MKAEVVFPPFYEGSREPTVLHSRQFPASVHSYKGREVLINKANYKRPRHFINTGATGKTFATTYSRSLIQRRQGNPKVVSIGTGPQLPPSMVVTDNPFFPEVAIKEEMESDTDTVDTQTDHSSCPSSPATTAPPSPKRPSVLPMDTVILVAKSKDGSKNSLVFRSLLRNRRAPGRVEKIRIIKTSPSTDIKNVSMPMRANLKQQLQRQQLLEQEKREQISQSFRANTHATGSAGISVPRVVESAEVPSTVLQVKTQLQHPTKYHVRQSQKRQVQHFLNEHQGGHLPIQSLPANVVPVSAPEPQQYHLQTSSSAPDPDLQSPLMGASGLAEFDPSTFDLLGDLQSVDPLELGSLLGDSDLIAIEPSLQTGSHPQSGFLPNYEGLESLEGDNSKSPSSCPTTQYRSDISTTGIMSVQDEMWRKERIKKDNHNMIERRRRFNINDRIKELGGLLPRTVDPDLRQNKGTILKASVDYIKSLQDDQRKYKAAMEQKRKAELDLRKVLLKLNQMQILMKSHGIENPLLGETELPAHLNMGHVVTTDFLNTAVTTTTQVMAPSTQHITYSAVEDLMDESSPVSGDPMLLSAPVSPEMDDHSFNFGFHS